MQRHEKPVRIKRRHGNQKVRYVFAVESERPTNIYKKMSVDRDTILNSMQSYIKTTRDHMSVQPQRLAEAAECMHEVRIIHETLMIFDNQLGPDLIAYLNMVD